MQQRDRQKSSQDIFNNVTVDDEFFWQIENQFFVNAFDELKNFFFVEVKKHLFFSFINLPQNEVHNYSTRHKKSI